MKILICGDRHWSNRASIYKSLVVFRDMSVTVVHGGAKGADTIGGEAAESLGFKTIVYPADWNKYGRLAGPIRNKQMLDEQPDIVLAFHDNIEQSKGTKHMVSIARKARIEVVVITVATHLIDS